MIAKDKTRVNITLNKEWRVEDENDLISRQAAIDAFMTATSDGDKVVWCRWVLEKVPPVQLPPLEASSDIYARVPDIYNVICARRDVTWRMYQSNKKMDPSDPHTARLFHEWLTLDSIASLFTDPVELETIKEIYHLNEED